MISPNPQHRQQRRRTHPPLSPEPGHNGHWNSQKTSAQSTPGGEAVESQKELAPDEVSTAQDSNRVKKTLSKREIMEQLSKERFPWDE